VKGHYNLFFTTDQNCDPNILHRIEVHIVKLLFMQLLPVVTLR